MDKLFDIKRGNVVMNPQTLWIPELKKLWTRDKSKDKAMAQKEISYIVFLYAYNSPYGAYTESKREAMILKDYFGDNKKWKPDAAVKAAIKKFNELQDSAALRLLRTTMKALEVIDTYFENAYNTAVNEGIVTDTMVDKVVKNAERLGGLIMSLNKLKTQVEKEQKEAASVRGDSEAGYFED